MHQLVIAKVLFFIVILIAVGSAPRSGAPKRQAKVGVVFNNVSLFWKQGERGGKHAAKDVGADLTIQYPSSATVKEQTRIIQAMIKQGFDVIIVSPIDPANQKTVLESANKNSTLVLIDTDSANVPRTAFVGTDQFEAGKLSGQLLKEALPRGGEVALFVGSKRAGVAAQRIEGISSAIQGTKITVKHIGEDMFDKNRARQRVDEALTKHKNLSAMVGVFSYNSPAIFESLLEHNKVGKIKVVAFDEDNDTLDSIEVNECVGTVVQNPYGWVYHAVRIGAASARGGEVKLEEKGVFNVPPIVVNSTNVTPFKAFLTGITKKPPKSAIAVKSAESAKPAANAKPGDN